VRFSLLTVLLLSGALLGPTPDALAADQARELGRVRWERDLDRGLERARETGRPVFLLFQEVPGCATCVGFGESVLSHPLLVEAIEAEFVAVAVLNNRGGADAAALVRFGEPAWNNPVVRFVDATGRDLLPRTSGVWDRHGIAQRMAEALRRGGREVPAYLGLVIEESRRVPAESAVFEMHCFWEGEACLGGLPGIRSTRAGWVDGREVVEVRFDPGAIERGALYRAARRSDCARSVFVYDEAERALAAAAFGEDAVALVDDPVRSARASDQKRHLRASPLDRLDLTPLQASRVNAALGRGEDPRPFLSPRQRAAIPAHASP